MNSIVAEYECICKMSLHIVEVKYFEPSASVTSNEVCDLKTGKDNRLTNEVETKFEQAPLSIIKTAE